ncbi:MAG: acyltransferase [Alphaproteobacteria bacterium]
MKNADIMRLICIWFMVTAHIGSNVRDAIVSDQGVFLVLFDGLSRLSSPGLGLISGYLAYLSLTRRSYVDLLIRRARSLLWPFLLWSMLYVSLLLAVSFLQGEDLDFGLLRSNVLWGLTSWPGNYPLHYLLDLFKCTALMGGAFVLLTSLGASQRTVTGSLLILSLIVFASLTLHDLNAGHPGRNQDSFLPRSDLQLFFSLGFVCADKSFRMFGALSTRPMLLVILAIPFVLTSLVWYDLLQNDILSLDYALGVILHFACRFTGAFLLFALVWRLPTPSANVGLFLRNLAFNVFVSHFIVLSALNSLFDLAPLMAYSPLVYVLALQLAFVLVGLSITLSHHVAGRIDLVRRPTSWRSLPEHQANHR